MPKLFALAATAMRPLAQGRGSCLASDRITIARQPVGFMYREPPDHSIDSGCRFFSGEETQEYADDASNFEIYDVNTIANHDPDIVPYLDAPAYSAFERHPILHRFVSTAFPG